MRKRRQPVISPRKAPRQARSATLVEDVLEAAVRVLAREGARRFTTVRVADEAGVSVGSLYQYFPNKEALLFRLQADEWNETLGIFEEILADRKQPPLARLRRAVVTFFRSEREEAELRVALDDAGALFRDAAPARAIVERAMGIVGAFMAEALPAQSLARRTEAADFVLTSMSAIAEKVTARRLTRREVDAWASSCADLLCHYVEALALR
ncbi:MAG: TetR family transcriptional regulator [Polyangiaceae bacterium]|nr:TetR family transcriptional regulator [Polyangiaceae bacterium]